MHILPSLLPLFLSLLLLLNPVSGKCYNTGTLSFAAFGAKTRARYFCFTYWEPPVLSGAYSRRETRKKCWDSVVPILYGYRWDFQITRKAGWFTKRFQHLSPQDCARYLITEIEGCQRGGERWRGQFFYRSDPNRGFCGLNPDAESTIPSIPPHNNQTYLDIHNSDNTNTNSDNTNTNTNTKTTDNADDDESVDMARIEAEVAQWTAEHEAGFRLTEEWLREQDMIAYNATLGL